MDPDRFIAVDVERDGQIAETLAQAADVLLVANRLIKEMTAKSGQTRTSVSKL